MIRDLIWRWLLGAQEAPGPEPRVVPFRFRDAELRPEPEVAPSGYEVEMSVSLHALAGIFGAHGWQLARPGRGPQPSPEDLADVLADMVLAQESYGDGAENAFYQFARFAVIRNADFPGSVDLFLNIGTATLVGSDEDEGEDAA